MLPLSFFSGTKNRVVRVAEFCQQKAIFAQLIDCIEMARRKVWLGISVAVVLIAAVAIYYSFDPATTPFPRCPFLVLTGWECPGCGSQRAIHSLLHLDIAAAWRYNAMLVLSIPYVVLLLVAEWLGRRRQSRLYRVLNSEVLIWSYFALVVAWWILRNVINI